MQLVSPFQQVRYRKLAGGSMPLHDGRPPCALWPAAGRAAASSSFVTAPGRAREQGGNEQRGVAFCCASSSENLKLSAAAVVSRAAVGGTHHHFPRSGWVASSPTVTALSRPAPMGMVMDGAPGRAHGPCGPGLHGQVSAGLPREETFGSSGCHGANLPQFFFSVRVFLEFPLDLQRKHGDIDCPVPCAS